mmetsp:Transcript_31768/g.84081  ORF Transcript_31768/g.84081 Transcript_31768/m.84081 type:complete len:146 (-) Transcript_31768:73-510(-)
MSHGEGRGIDEVKGTINATLSTMQDNMRQMAERDSQLSSLQASTAQLQGAASMFSQSSRQLQANNEWQKCRLYILAVLIATWIPVFFMRRPWLFYWAPGTLLLFGVIVYLRNYLANMRESQYRTALQHGYSAELPQRIGGFGPLE